ncbi:DUF1932 domain-containing protein [Acuticoccus sp. MNP-M23]|uniref:NAD(P)-dependent oxidoreductase n=1 Tax=Acuticoccus sp. MNP-M23 TaxID=3072793 RepID=UPI002814B820|nr:DUF1932 domain-containing protein [Acuticoccus sp. MNP-M23]WMS44448.1 DUF1932 domain-containing protein [Acuticoccus sp. MNP-M23]
MRIAFIGYGEAARAFRKSLGETNGAFRFAAYDIKGTPEMAAAMEADGTARGATVAEAIDGADWIFSAVTADQSYIAAEAALPHLTQGQVFIDINSVSPQRKRDTAAAVEAREAVYLDMAVMSPVHPNGHASPVLLAGPAAERLAAEMKPLGFTFEVAGNATGEATAVKMVRSLFVKGLEAITVEALLAASASGCFDRVLESLSKSFPGLGWPEHASYYFERTLHHGTRRAAEMEESAATLNELGLEGGLAARIAAVQRKMGAMEATDLPEGPLADGIAAILAARLAQ